MYPRLGTSVLDSNIKMAKSVVERKKSIFKK